MNDLLTFMGEHPFLTWCLAWGIWPVCSVLTSPFRYAFRAYNRRLRNMNIARHGWPPPHLDADGDFRPVIEQETAS